MALSENTDRRVATTELAARGWLWQAPPRRQTAPAKRTKRIPLMYDLPIPGLA